MLQTFKQKFVRAFFFVLGCPARFWCFCLRKKVEQTEYKLEKDRRNNLLCHFLKAAVWKTEIVILWVSSTSKPKRNMAKFCMNSKTTSIRRKVCPVSSSLPTFLMSCRQTKNTCEGRNLSCSNSAQISNRARDKINKKLQKFTNDSHITFYTRFPHYETFKAFFLAFTTRL